MKSLTSLLTYILADASILCGTTTTRDVEYVTSRVKSEGISFLTITLSDFASDFERGLMLGQLEPTSFRSFGKKGQIPRFLSGIVSQVFDSSTGKLLDEPSVACISCVRQICRMFKKVLLPSSKVRKDACYANYLQIEKDLANWSFSFLDDSLIEDFCKISDVLWSRVLSDLSNKISRREHIPRHGPGATAEKLSANSRYAWKQWHLRLEEFFPSDTFMFYNTNAFVDESHSIRYLTPDQELPVRVVDVPKTCTGPRIIAVEPACMQYTQQSILHDLVDTLENSDILSGAVRFRDQSINQALALSSSKSGHLATLDLKDASDRVHQSLVWRMLRSVPDLRNAIFACRSTRALLPTGITIQLEKFASMGSALCFPIESMVFLTISLIALLRSRKLPISTRSIKLCLIDLHVYGDDIIVPTESGIAVMDLLETFMLRVNRSKSFLTGKFRESCGMDAYNGVDVTSVYLRRMPPTTASDVNSLVSYVEFSNQLYKRGYFKTAQAIEEKILKLGIKIPYGRQDAGYVRFVRDHRSLTIERRCDLLHRPMVKAFVVSPRREADQIDSHYALTKYFLQGMSRDRKCYDSTIGNGRLTLKRRWCYVV